MAATDHRRSALLAGTAVAVVALVALGPCRSDDGIAPLPPSALDGLALEAEVRPDVLTHEIALRITLDADADRAIEVPGLSVDATPPDVRGRVLAHRGRLPGGGVLLSIGRGRPEDVEVELGRSYPAPVLIVPGAAIDLVAGVAPVWEGRGGPADATVEELDDAELVRVCLWGVLHPPAAAPTSPTPVVDTRQLGCVDVAR